MKDLDFSSFFKNAVQEDMANQYLLQMAQKLIQIQSQCIEKKAINDQKLNELIHQKMQQVDIQSKKIDQLIEQYRQHNEIQEQRLTNLELDKQAQEQQTNHSSAVWIDQKAGLMWSRICLGQTWENEQCAGHAKELSWNKARKQCQEFELADFKDWRLPTITELKTLLKMNALGTLQNVLFLPNRKVKWTFWSGVNSSATQFYLPVADFETNTTKSEIITYNKFLVRPVRDLSI